MGRQLAATAASAASSRCLTICASLSVSSGRAETMVRTQSRSMRMRLTSLLAVSYNAEGSLVSMDVMPKYSPGFSVSVTLRSRLGRVMDASTRPPVMT